MIKKIVLVLLAAFCVYTAYTSPYSVSNALASKDKLENASVFRTTAKARLDKSKQDLKKAANAFESARYFDIHYTDVVRVKQLIDAVTGVSFYGLYEADPATDYALCGQLDLTAFENGGGELPAALCLSIIAEDTASGLRVLDKLEMPVVRIETNEPGRIDIIFLTGGDR